METAPQTKRPVISSTKSLVILAIMALFTIFNCTRKCSTDNDNEAMKKTILESDSLRVAEDGHYLKLVNDLNSEKQLNAILKANNADLYKQLKAAGKKPIMYTAVEATFKPKVETVVANVESNDCITAYYPTSINPFITFTRTKLTDSTAQNKWDFGKLKIDIVVSEKVKGLFEADIKGADFLQVTKVNVNSLPLTPIVPNNFDWIVGGGLMYNPQTFSVVPQVSAGARYKKTTYVFQSTGQFHGGSILKAF